MPLDLWVEEPCSQNHRSGFSRGGKVLSAHPRTSPLACRAYGALDRSRREEQEGSTLASLQRGADWDRQEREQAMRDARRGGQPLAAGVICAP